MSVITRSKDAQRKHLCGEREAMSRISIDIADDLLLALREQPQDVVQEMRVGAALHYFQTRRLSLGQAARLAGIPRVAFLDVLMAHGIPAFDLSVEDADAEIAAARRVDRTDDHQ
jgi:predicted HTH domain antitoxin